MKHYAFVIFALAMICLNKCHSYYCVVKGSVRGIEDGATIQMLDAWDHYAKLDSVIVDNGAFAFRPNISAPTRVFLYQGNKQLKGFILEPGAILVDIDTSDEMNPFTGAEGTISNDTYRKLMELAANNDKAAVEDLKKEIIEAEKEANNMILWFLRILGVMIVIGGLKGIFGFIETILKVVPFIAGIFGWGVGLVCTVLGVVWSLIVIALAWLFYRPLLGISLLVLAGFLVWVFAFKGKDKLKELAAKAKNKNGVPVPAPAEAE